MQLQLFTAHAETSSAWIIADFDFDREHVLIVTSNQTKKWEKCNCTARKCNLTLTRWACFTLFHLQHVCRPQTQTWRTVIKYFFLWKVFQLPRNNQAPSYIHHHPHPKLSARTVSFGKMTLKPNALLCVILHCWMMMQQHGELCRAVSSLSMEKSNL